MKHNKRVLFVGNGVARQIGTADEWNKVTSKNLV